MSTVTLMFELVPSIVWTSVSTGLLTLAAMLGFVTVAKRTSR